MFSCYIMINFMISIKTLIVYLPLAMNSVIFPTISNIAKGFDLLDCNPYWLSLNSTCL